MVETNWGHHNNCLTQKIKSEKNIAFFFSVEFFVFVSNINFTVIRTRTFLASMPDPEVIKLFSRSTQMSTKFQLLIKTKIPTNKEVTSFKSLRCCIYPAHFILLINVKMPTIVGILTFMSRINFMLSLIEHEKNPTTSGPVLNTLHAGYFFMLFCHLLIFFKINFFE